MSQKKHLRTLSLLPILAVLGAAPGFAQDAPIPAITIKADQVTTKVSPTLYGLMTEEINYSYEGGLYGELLRNRTFQANAADPAHPAYWETIGMAGFSLDSSTPFNDALKVSSKLDATTASKAIPQGIASSGFWGIPVKAKTPYHVSFYAKAASGYTGGLTLTLESKDGKTIYATALVQHVTGGWKKYQATLVSKTDAASKENQFTLTTATPGTLWLQQVSLFPPTYKNRANGNRSDIMEMLADMKPKFLRLPGGNYLEGDTIAERFDWKKTIGDVAQRPGHESPWKYWSTDGLGLLEYLEWCEDLNMQPVLAVYAGYSLHQERVAAGPDMQPYIQDALDEIEYVTGDASTKWGAQRIKDGHPAPFPLTYVEIGNEDWFDNQNTYDARFTQFYDAIKAKYPKLQLISTITPDRPDSQKVHSRTPDLVDEHLYPNNEGAMESRAHEFDALPRTGPKIFVGEWATRIGAPTPNMTAALADAAWMTGMERNSDLVVLESYAPLFTNVSHVIEGRNPETSMQWPSDLIGYDAATSYGSPSYYAQAMFSSHHGDVVLASDAQNVPTWTWQPPTPRPRTPPPAAAGTAPATPPAPPPAPPPPPPPQQLPSLYYDVTRDSGSGTIFLKVVNRNGTPQPVKIAISGVTLVAAAGEAVVLKASSPDDTNTIADPKKVVPVTEKVTGLSASFTRDFPAYSITVLELQAK